MRSSRKPRIAPDRQHRLARDTFIERLAQFLVDVFVAALFAVAILALFVIAAILQ